MTQQAELVAGRILRLDTTQNSPDPEDGDDPDITLSPRAPTGSRTSGFILILKQPSSGAAVPSGTGETFNITVWVRNPVTKIWGSGDTVPIGYNQAFVAGDVDATELYFQIGNVDSAGEIDFHVCEQGEAGHGIGLRRLFAAASAGGGGGGGGGSEFDTTTVSRYPANATQNNLLGEVTRRYLLIVNHSETDLFVKLGDSVDPTPGAESASIVLDGGVDAAFEVLNYIGPVSFQYADATDETDGYALLTRGYST
jgi:hypothetical protein